MTRKFWIWIDGYASDNKRLAITDGGLPQLTGLERIAYEIKPVSADVVDETIAREISRNDNS